MNNILYVEDDLSLIDGLKYTLETSGYMIDISRTVKEALTLFKQSQYDLLLLDVTLPDGTGFDICREVRKLSTVPIIFLTASDEEISIVRGLDMGGDDYITKPFDNQELLVRIEAVLRRFQKSTTPNNSKILRFKDLSLDTEAMEAKIRNTPITLTRYEYLILQLLMSSPSKVFTKNNIFESVWNENFIGDDNAINVHIGNLRKKFAKVNPEEKYIQTVWGLGFKMQG